MAETVGRCGGIAEEGRQREVMASLARSQTPFGNAGLETPFRVSACPPETEFRGMGSQTEFGNQVNTNRNTAGEPSPPSRSLTGPAGPWRSVCAPGNLHRHSIADRLVKGD